MAIPATPTRYTPWAVALVIVLCIAGINLLAWQLFHGQLEAPEHDGPVAGFSYNGADRWQSPIKGQRPSVNDLDQDLALLSRHTRRIRTYSAADHPELPSIAHKHGLQVMLGAWIDERLDSNQRELATAINLARSHSNVHRLIVGNETQLKAMLPPNRLIAYLDQVRAALRTTTVQVSTAEPWHVWLAQPQLAQHVDFIAIHVLPYWEKESIESAVHTSLNQIARVQARFPDHRIVVAEIGWPSNGPSLGKARASAENQALFVRHFLQQTEASGLDYYLIEAFDQPWKIATEGRAGAYWGRWDAWRNPKYELTGPVLKDPRGQQKAWAASVLGAVVMLAFLLAVPQIRLAGRITFCAAAQAVVSAGVILVSIPLAHYLTLTDIFGLVLVVAALVFISATLLAQAFEFSERFWPGDPVSDAPAPDPANAVNLAPPPFISIHLACANEPPEMVIQSVESLLAIDWPAFEVIVVDNNTTDPQAREQLAAWMAHRQDPRLRFAQWVHLPGYKAGALNQALTMTDPTAGWIAVVDADYVVDPQWFRQVQIHFQDASVGLVQAPQAHRQWSARRFDRMMNWETEGFFRIGMHHRNERNAIIQHGTMTIVRAADLRHLRWNEDCICEDTELGLRLLRSGYRAVYVDRVLGAGLLPRDFAAYARQRKRWAQGAMQIFRRHAGSLLGRSRLTLAQRYHFLAGWLPWLGDALHFLFSIIMIAFSLGMVYLPAVVEPPLWLFVVPLIAFFTARLLVGPLLYTRCVPCGLADRMGAAVAGMALSHRIARGVLQGLRGRQAVFEITQKASATSFDNGAAETAAVGPRFVQGIKEEFALLGGLVFCICLLALSHSPADTGRSGWIAILVIQSLPYWAAVVCKLVESKIVLTATQTKSAQPADAGKTKSTRP
ncbi:MAG: glycosyltransferase [Rhodocyclaceae bacterium]|nr:glycosyltransferase [Rhodocyclaceae bacterium]MDZ4213213.1 glycosyltransferase [Rhodocyclaceae bacterium]